MRLAGNLPESGNIEETEIGFKYELPILGELWHSVAIMGHWVVNWNRIGFDSFNGRISVEKDVFKKMGIGCNIGFKKDANSLLLVYTLVFGYELSSEVGTYVEIYGDNEQSHIDGGFTYSWSQSVQFDISVSKSILKNDYYLSTGISFYVK